MDSDSDRTEPLQFETAIPRDVPTEQGTAAAAGVMCVACQRPILDKYFDANAQSVCESCRNEIAPHAGRHGMGCARARGLFGVVAAILGAILYYAVIAITDFEIGIVAIAIRLHGGLRCPHGTRGRGGRRFQVLALLLTYWAVGLAYTPFLFSALSEDDATQQASTNTSTNITVAADVPAAPDSTDGADASDTSNPLLALAVLLAIPLTLPVLTVVSSLPGGLISAAIIAFGMHQAWRMTGVPQVVITRAVSHWRRTVRAAA